MTQAIDKFNRPLKDLRISIIDRCNFRCPYCMPENEYKTHSFLDNTKWLNFDEIERVTGACVDLGVTKVRITGGEPLLRPRIHELIGRLSKFKKITDLALTTNGSLLATHAQALKNSGLHRLTVSLDTLDSKIFKELSGGRGRVQDILDGIQAAEQAGFSSIKINVVVKKEVNDHTILDIVRYFKGTDHTLRFIEYMDVGNCNHWKSRYVVPSSELAREINALYPIVPMEETYYGEVAQRYKYIDGSGEIGFISSISQPFCQSCTRLRLSADGQLYTCLFASRGTDIRPGLKNISGIYLKELITNVWKDREDRYSELRGSSQLSVRMNNKVEMYHIGG